MIINDKEKHLLCPVAWISQSIRANGDMRICCQAQHGPTGGIIKHKDGSSMNSSKDTFETAINSDLSKEVRRYMMEGKWHPECIRCENEEKNNIRSRRIYENESWIEDAGYDWRFFLENTNEDGTIDLEKIKTFHYDLRFGNLCNLKCRMCGPTDSSQWYEDQVKLWGDTYNDSHGKVKLVKNKKEKYVPEIDVYSWHENNFFWKNMENNIPYIQKLYLVGGEPLMIDKHYDFLQNCIESGFSKNITVEYNSNITNIPEKAFDIWKHFGKIQIGASIDCFDKVNNYIRFPSKFDKIYNNLKKLSVAEGNFKIWIASTISVYNILYLPDFITWCIKNRLPRVNDSDHKPIMLPHPLHGPKFLNTKVLPKSAKDIIAKKFEDRKKDINELILSQSINETRKDAMIETSNNMLNQYKSFMYSDDYSDLLQKFWYHTRKLDEIRGHSIENFCPELYELIAHTEKN